MPVAMPRTIIVAGHVHVKHWHVAAPRHCWHAKSIVNDYGLRYHEHAHTHACEAGSFGMELQISCIQSLGGGGDAVHAVSVRGLFRKCIFLPKHAGDWLSMLGEYITHSSVPAHTLAYYLNALEL